MPRGHRRRFLPLILLAVWLMVGLAACGQVGLANSATATPPATATGSPPASPVPLTPSPNPADITPGRYLDDRSDPVQVLRSYYNAVNRKEYLRAYAYWQTTAALPPFPQFAQGYAQTQAVTLTTGTVVSDPGAGQLHYAVPVTVQATLAGGGVQLFAGCYRLHLTQPALQERPPFQPLGITAADIQPVADAAAAAVRMARGCP